MADINEVYDEEYIGESDDEEFIGESDDDDDDDEVDIDDGDGNGKSKQKNDIILQGSIDINDEGHYVYSGTWGMQQDTSADKPGKSDLGDEGSKNNSNNIKKKKKFKLKSKEQLKDESTKTTTNLLTVENGDNGSNDKIDKPQSILFNGFFVTDETDKIQPHRKVKERDVEMTFSRVLDPSTRGSSNRDTDKLSRRYRVEGRGANEFGSFSIEGSYTLHQQNGSEKKDGVSLTCRKWYTPVVKPKKRRWDDGEGIGSEDDDEISRDETTDFDEIIGLQDEAGMSIEELRKRYYGGEENASDPTVCKKSKLMDEDNDDGCGF